MPDTASEGLPIVLILALVVVVGAGGAVGLYLLLRNTPANDAAKGGDGKENPNAGKGDGAPKVHYKGNLLSVFRFARGDAAAAEKTMNSVRLMGFMDVFPDCVLFWKTDAELRAPHRGPRCREIALAR